VKTCETSGKPDATRQDGETRNKPDKLDINWTNRTCRPDGKRGREVARKAYEWLKQLTTSGPDWTAEGCKIILQVFLSGLYITSKTKETAKVKK